MESTHGDPVTPETVDAAQEPQEQKPIKPKKKKSPHTGHRQRLKNEFLAYGEDEKRFHSERLLELMLCYAIPQGDVAPIAHALLDHFYSFDQVLDAPIEELLMVPGVGEHTATLLKLFLPVSRRYQAARRGKGRTIRNTRDAVVYMEPYFQYLSVEKAYMACMDGGGRVLRCDELNTGTERRVTIDPQQILRIALKTNATSVLLAHNHVMGKPLPSTADISSTQHIKQLLNNMQIHLFDHLIFMEDGIASALTGRLT